MNCRAQRPTGRSGAEDVVFNELSSLTGVRCSLIRATLKSLSSRGLIHVAESGFRLRIIDHELDRAERRSRHGRKAAACRWAVIKEGRDE